MSFHYPAPIPAQAWIGLRSHHFREILDAPPPAGSTRSNAGSPRSNAKSSPVASLPQCPNLNRKLMRYIRHDNTQPKPVKWKYFDASRRITPESIVTGH